MNSNTAQNEFERWYVETIPYMDFGSRKAMIWFAYEAGARYRSLGDKQLIDEQSGALKRLRKTLSQVTFIAGWALSEAEAYIVDDYEGTSSFKEKMAAIAEKRAILTAQELGQSHALRSSSRSK